MADSQQFKIQNLENKQEAENQPPIIKCLQHQDQIYEAININPQYDKMLVCIDCIISERLSGDNLVSIKKFFTKNDQDIITNWPPLIDLKMQQLLKNIDISENQNNINIQKVISLFDDFKTNFTKLIDEQQKNVVSHIHKVQEQRLKVIQFYDEISNTEEIKQQFKINQTNINELESYLKTTVFINQKQNSQNKKILQDIYENAEKQQNKLQIEYIENILQQTLKNIKQIDLLNPSLTFQEQFKSQDKIASKVIIDQKENIKKNDHINKNNSLDIKNGDILTNVTIIKTKYGNPDLINIKRIGEKQIEIEHTSQEGWGQVKVNELINLYSKYWIQIELNSSNLTNDKIALGIIPLSKSDLSGRNNKLSLLTSGIGDGIDKLEKGQHISTFRNKIGLINFQICLNEKIFRCMAFSNYQYHINSLSDWSIIEQNQQYQFFISLYEANQIIRIKEFQIVQEFDR